MARLVKRLALSLGVLGALVLGAELYLRKEGYGAIPNVWFDPDMGTRFHPSHDHRAGLPRQGLRRRACRSRTTHRVCW